MIRPTAGAHVPVLLDEMLAALAVRSDGVYLDGTFGGGGYSRAILGAGAGRLYGLDRDPAAVAGGRQLAAERPQFTMLEGRFGDMAAHLAAAGVRRLDGIVLDLGLSSEQLDDSTRGFSFAADGPLDMRMSRAGQSAAELVNEADEATLATILYRYGEERAARRIARAIVERRRRTPFAGTRELAAVVAGAIGGHRGRIDPATRTFQALRIYLNEELDELERALAAAEGLLAPGGRLVIVAFHSLEDRPVKRFLAARSGDVPRPSRHQPEPTGVPEAARFRLLSRHPVRPTAEEVRANPRARSARLRAAERLGGPGD
ncbi:MAG TPA: 16S rRNA (cytosine(1402)-N(4))-methyltransferase RsmH [Geminicoccaceae bacterium]|nr:16S rRNA (cytosine(1402)-N(4))-methyltransferase RsmH [Geminicoccaceae bacterium]